MSSFDTLKQHLLFSSAQLLQAAEEKCVDQSFIFDTIYLAIIKTKQKYKKLANKERAVDVCISLMKQPKTHVKHSFSSVEDCIEKAMAAKVVPWKPIVSTVAVVLVAAILIPHLLPDAGTTYMDPSGFVMENTLALKNQVSSNNILLQNLHHPTDLGTENESTLSGVPWSPINQNIRYDSITTTKGETFLVIAYCTTNGKTHEFILYKAEVNGWREVGRDSIRLTTIDDYYLNSTIFAIDEVVLTSDADGNVYVISLYDEGIQLHQFNSQGNFLKVNQIWITDNLPVKDETGSANAWCPHLSARINEESTAIHFFCELKSGISTSQYCTLSYDLSSQQFSTPCYTEKASAKAEISTFSNDGTCYVIAEPAPVDDESGIPVYTYYIYKVEGNEITQKIEIASGHGFGTNKMKVYLLEASEDKLHLVYSQQHKYYHVIYQDGVEVERYRFYALSTDPIEYMTFFLYNDTPHYLASVNKEYLLVARIVEGKAEKIGEFVMPFFFLGTEYDIRRFTPVLSGGNVVNYLINGCEDTVQIYTMPTTYFFQIILN